MSRPPRTLEAVRHASPWPRAAVALLLALACLVPASASAQGMNVALSRLRLPNGTGGCDGADFCPDNEAWTSLATQLAGALIPPLVQPAHTRGPRSFYLGVETMLTGIESNQEYWQRGTEGDAGSIDRNRAVDSVLAWTRISMRKPLPFGFELGMSGGYVVDTDYFTLGAELRWALLEGWTGRDWLVPDFAVRAAVQTLIGDAQFNMTIVALDATLSNSFIIGDAFELSPYVAGQVNFTFADTELVDLTPTVDAWGTCQPEPPDPSIGAALACTGDASDFNNNAVFRSLRTIRPRMVFGAQARYEIVTVNAAFSFDLVPPHDVDAVVSSSVPRQLRLDIGLGLSY